MNEKKPCPGYEGWKQEHCQSEHEQEVAKAPWKVDYDGTCYGHAVRGADEEFIATDLTCAEANLIAAAPELLDAARQVLTMYPPDIFTGESGDEGARLVLALRAAVTKAEGQKRDGST